MRALNLCVLVLILMRTCHGMQVLIMGASGGCGRHLLTDLSALSEAELLEHARGCDAIFSCLGHHEPGAKGVTWKGVYGPKNQRHPITYDLGVA